MSVIILGIGYGMIWLVSGLSNQNGEVVDIQINDKDFSAGPSDGEITLVEYSDFQCPACAVWYPILNQLKSDAEIKDQLRIIYRFFPLSQIHTNAELSSRSAYAAGKQNKFWEYHDVLFEKQEEWSKLSTPLAKERFIAYAEAVGVDRERFISDTDSSEARKVIKDSYDKGVRLGVNSTPTFFVNGVKLRSTKSYEELKSVLLSSRATPTSQ